MSPSPVSPSPVSASPALLLAQRGNKSARAQLLKEYGPAVWGLCRRLSPEPEDAYQLIWAHAFEQLARFDPNGTASLKTWLLTLAHRKLIDAHRARKVRGAVIPFNPQTPDPSPDSGEKLDQARRIAKLENAISQLPPDQARVVLLHHLNGHPLSAISQAEGLPIGTLKSRLHRARARLLDLMQ
ncbi:MAG: RNA polymerase sigma factor (sigma-70 family) [Cognaticolwellia sp.]